MEYTQESLMLAEKALIEEKNYTEHVYIDICGDLVAGTLLSQIIYWFKPSSDGKNKLRVRKDGILWLAKRREDWYDEIRITPKQYDRAIRLLQDKGFVELKLFMFGGHPTTHIRPIPEKINEATAEWVHKKALSYEKEPENNENSPILPKGKIANSPKGKLEIDERGNCITEYTNNTTTENTIKVNTNNINQDKKYINNNSIKIKLQTQEPVPESLPTSEKLNIFDTQAREDFLTEALGKLSVKYVPGEYNPIAYLLSEFAFKYTEKMKKQHSEIKIAIMYSYLKSLIKLKSKTHNCNLSILDFDKDDIDMMIDSFFDYNFSKSCDYSFNLFMDSNVLESRIWDVRNKKSALTVIK